MERDGIAKHESSDSSTNYRYWVRESGEGAAPPPVPKKLSADDVSKQQASQTNPSLGSVWNKVFLCVPSFISLLPGSVV